MQQPESESREVSEVQAPRSLNPFAGERQAIAEGATNTSEVHRAVAEVQAAIMLAKQFPRDKREAVDRILIECCRQTLAESATYSYTRGKEEVTGPSIRLAEVLAANWGNFKYGWKETGRRNGMSEIVTFAWDYETNTQSTRDFAVRHWRDTKKGGYALTSERDIYELCANQAARRMRACILNVIPGDVIDAAIKQCDLTLVTNEVVTPEKVEAMIKAFEIFGVTKEHIEKRLGKKALDITGAMMVQLRKIYNGLKEGMSRPSEFFDVPEEASTPQAKPASDTNSLMVGIDATEKNGLSNASGVSDIIKVDQKSEIARKVKNFDVLVDSLIAGIIECNSVDEIDKYMFAQQPDLTEIGAAGRIDLIEKILNASGKRKNSFAVKAA